MLQCGYLLFPGTVCQAPAWLLAAELDCPFACRACPPCCPPLILPHPPSSPLAPQARCAEAYSAVRAFESRCCVSDASLPASFVAARSDWVSTAATFAAAFRLKDESLHDGVLLLDRAVAAGGEQLLGLNAAALIVGCLLIASRQGGRRAGWLKYAVPHCPSVALSARNRPAATTTLLQLALSHPSRPCLPSPQPARPQSACRSPPSWRRPPACPPCLWRRRRPPCARCCRATPRPSLVSLAGAVLLGGLQCRCAASAATPWQVGTRQLFIACTAGTTFFLLASSSADPACCGYSSDCILYLLPSSLQLCACSSCCWSGWAPTSRFPVAWPPWPDLPSCWWVGGCCALRWVGACGWCAAGGGECTHAQHAAGLACLPSAVTLARLMAA